jgi:hypothetical protein
MDPQHAEYLALALFVASELIGMSNLRSNSLLQLLVSVLRQAFPYEPKPKRKEPTASPFDIFSIRDRDHR